MNSVLPRNIMSQSEMYFLAVRARSKLTKEASRGEYDLRILVSHANLLDWLMDSLAEQRSRAAEKRTLVPQATKVFFKLPAANRSTIHVAKTDEDWYSNSDSEYDSESDSEDEEEYTYEYKPGFGYVPFREMPTIGEEEDSKEDSPDLCYSSSDAEEEDDDELVVVEDVRVVADTILSQTLRTTRNTLTNTSRDLDMFRSGRCPQKIERKNSPGLCYSSSDEEEEG
jgi:hypothetical protein